MGAGGAKPVLSLPKHAPGNQPRPQPPPTRKNREGAQKKIGSNALLKENALRLQAKQGWRVLHRRAAFSGWCPRQELNLYLQLRRLTVYPLTYEGKPKNSTVLCVVWASTSGNVIFFSSATTFATSTT